MKLSVIGDFLKYINQIARKGASWHKYEQKQIRICSLLIQNMTIKWDIALLGLSRDFASFRIKMAANNIARLVETQAQPT